MKKHNNKFTVTEHKVYFTPFINATSPKTGGAKLRLSLSSVSLIESLQNGAKRGVARAALLPVLDGLKSLVASNGGLIDERTKGKMKKWTKGLGKVGGRQLAARLSLMLQRYRRL